VTFGDRDRTDNAGPLDVRVIGHPTYVRGQRTNPFHIRAFTALGDADVVHCHQQHILMTSAAALWCRARHKRVFVSDLGGGGWDVSAYVSTDRWFHGHLHLSDYSRRIYRHEDLPAALVIGGGVDINKFSPDVAIARDGGALFVGRVLPHKGIDNLIRGLPPGTSLMVVGPQPDRHFVAQLTELARGKDVTFREEVDDTTLVREYRRSMCIVLPSVYRTADGVETTVPELLGQTLLEGMACEAPAICTNVASLPEIVDDSVTGFVVPPNNPEAIGDRLRALRSHRDRVAVMGKAARSRVLKCFAWDGVVKRCLDAYEGARKS
jgi:glycosyltransferase involved in cell wall biosynthesis